MFPQNFDGNSSRFYGDIGKPLELRNAREGLRSLESGCCASPNRLASKADSEAITDVIRMFR